MQISGSQQLIARANAGAAVLAPGVIAIGRSASGPSLTMVPGTHFAANSVVHAPLAANAPLDSNSATIVANFLLQLQLLDPTRGYYMGVQTLGNTPPIWIAPANAPTQQLWVDPADVNAQPLNCEMNAVPFSVNFAVSPGSDSESMIYQPSTGGLWETWNTRTTGRMILNSAGQSVREWGAQWGGHMGGLYPPLPQNRGYWPPISGSGGDPRCGNYDGYLFGTSASGQALLAGMMTIEEQRAGVINHCLHMAIGWTKANTIIPPAQRSDGFSTASYAIAEGTCFRFPANLDFTPYGLTPYGLMVARAIQSHGLYVRDGTGSVSTLYAQDWVNWSGDPYSGADGIFGGLSPSTDGVLAGMPFDRLQVVDWHALPI